jgi:hypothetical protein
MTWGLLTGHSCLPTYIYDDGMRLWGTSGGVWEHYGSGDYKNIGTQR